MKQLAQAYKGKTVLVTGHTGFKGSWLALWLTQLGAKVIGYALAPPTTPAHLDILDLDMLSVVDDMRNREVLARTIESQQPEIIFHLAAQPLVRQSYKDPVETYETNVMGTVNLLEACRQTPAVRAIVNITTDKCYENREWIWGYKEIDPLGGYDPYSSSKACSELITGAYRSSFFNPDDYNRTHNCLVATARAGNVIGGGDWADDRLVPDIIRAIAKDEKVQVRSPRATRPWQHVLEPLSGYLLLGKKLLEGQVEFAQAWNFGPDESVIVDVETLVRTMKREWPRLQVEINSNPPGLHEANLLKLDSTKAHEKLDWWGTWSFPETIARTTDWYRRFLEDEVVQSFGDLRKFTEDYGKK